MGLKFAGLRLRRFLALLFIQEKKLNFAQMLHKSTIDVLFSKRCWGLVILSFWLFPAAMGMIRLAHQIKLRPEA
ncbi:hypothetical protein B0E43_04565 [Algoriphagus sp. A40]|nr:hypothetical protein B0E43_04565 [Algoriphagus sp. A40]